MINRPDLPDLNNPDVWTNMTPLELLVTQEQATKLLEQGFPAIAEMLLSCANQELIKRGRCTVCALEHPSTQCPRIAAARKSAKNNRTGEEGEEEGGVLV